METKTNRTIWLRGLVAFGLITRLHPSTYAEPLRLTPDGPIGDSSEGFAIPVEDMRRQLDAYWDKGDRIRFFHSGKMLVSGLADRRKDEGSVKLYLQTCTHVLNHPTEGSPYAKTILEQCKSPMVQMMLGGDYLKVLSAEEYRNARRAVLKMGTSHMDELRKAFKDGAPRIPPPDMEYKEKDLSEEKRAMLIKRFERRSEEITAASADVIAVKKIPEVLEEIETRFVKFVEQEYRRVSPEKGELEAIIAKAGLPEEATARLKVLIPP